MVCPFKNEIKIDRLSYPIAYAFKHKLDSVRMASSSGGAYTAISNFVIGCNSDNIGNAICYGAAFDKDFTVHHAPATMAAERDLFRGSKYVQSDLGQTFYKIKQNLNDGKTVLFTGTPCQTAGLANFLEVLNTDKRNLILNDIICHGTPSPMIWKDYVGFIQDKYKSRLQDYTFRFKEMGWHSYFTKAKLENKKCRANTTDIRIYINLYFSLMIHRPCCYHCKFTNLNRPSDITVGDFWGIEKCFPEFGDDKGVSLVILNTPKGQALFNKLQDQAECKQSSLDDCMQHSLREPNEQPLKREQFWRDYYEHGFIYIAKAYAGYRLTVKAKRLCGEILGQLGLLSLAKNLIKIIKGKA